MANNNEHVKELLDAGVHFGHLTRKWNPNMAPYIYMERNGIHIINLYKTTAKLAEANEALTKIAASGRKILFVKKMALIDRSKEDGTFNSLSKKERLAVDRSRAKLEKNLGSISDMTRLPGALFVVDTTREHIAVAEALKLKIPIFAMVDTNCDPNIIDYVIPSNDDASKSIDKIMTSVSNAVIEGLSSRKGADEKTEKEATPTTPAKAETPAKKAPEKKTARKRVAAVEVKAAAIEVKADVSSEEE